MNKAHYVDPIIGTVGDEQDTSFHGGGKTHPGATLPSGMVQLSPDTVTGGDNGTGYNYCQDTIEGFSFNHMSGIGWYGDLGNLQVMPTVGKTDLRSGSNAEVLMKKATNGWRSPFSHEKETARAGYYAVELLRYGIFAEATVTEHTGWLRFTYQNRKEAGILFNFSRRIAGHADYETIDIPDDHHIEGHICCTPNGGGFGRGAGGIAYDLYFAIELSEPMKRFRFFADEEYQTEALRHFEHADAGLKAYFDENGNAPIVIKCGISYVDIEGARNNLHTEADEFGFDFDRVAERAFDTWEKALDTVTVEGTDENDKAVFYTCLYHALLDPRTATDADGRFLIDGKIYREQAHTQRTMFSGWDVYRSEFPLLTLLRPKLVEDEIASLLTIADSKNTSLPRWELMGIDSGCMCGDPATLIAADAYLKGLRGFDAEKIADIAVASSRGEAKLGGRDFRSTYPIGKNYLNDAYVPNDLSRTLEYLLADYAIARLLRALGREQEAAYYEARVKRYGENYNRTFGYMAPRDEDGNFLPIDDRYSTVGCVESNIFQQSWFVPYDVDGVATLFGRERTIELLEELFDGADLSALWNENYNHSNEPCHNLTHYFSLLGKAHRTQYWTRRVQKEAYRTGPFGFCGNEDVGQLSGWYVLSAMGFAQICPANDVYFLNTPLFRRVELKLDKTCHACGMADTLIVECDKDPLTYPYIASVTLNGKKIDRPYVTYAEITDGGVLSFALVEEPTEAFTETSYDFFA